MIGGRHIYNRVRQYLICISSHTNSMLISSVLFVINMNVLAVPPFPARSIAPPVRSLPEARWMWPTEVDAYFSIRCSACVIGVGVYRSR